MTNEREIVNQVVESLNKGDSLRILSDNINYSIRSTNYFVKLMFGMKYKQVLTMWRLSSAFRLIYDYGYTVLKAVEEVYKSTCTACYYRDVKRLFPDNTADVNAHIEFKNLMFLYKELISSTSPVALSYTSCGSRHSVWQIRHVLNLRLLAKPGCGYYISPIVRELDAFQKWVTNYRTSLGIMPYVYKA